MMVQLRWLRLRIGMGRALARLGGRRASVLALLCVAGICHAQSESFSFGTLLFSPAERAAIAAGRKGEGVAPEAAGSVVKLTGVVARSGHKGTAWINGRPVAEGEAVANAGTPVIEAGRVVIEGRPVRVRESLEVETGAKSDTLRGGSVSVRSGK